ncbi:hypothetical protein DKX38_002793 [Salix brachista]|uniref:Uncharacterized protein n=1 Tax=Salix brachista TaxID=2182728 RepID=A0A5N5NN20_9ROSI|nr:hypothetical protein DKX38_002793 [Salix brachista]
MSRSGKQESSERSSRFWRRSSICSGKKCTIQAWKRYIARSITMTGCKKIDKLGFGQQYSPSGDYN